MAKYIELCGSPGVGKSTIFEEIEKRERKSNFWKTVTDLYPTGKENWNDFATRIFFDLVKGRSYTYANPEVRENFLEYIKRVGRTIKRGKNYLEEDFLKKAGERFVAQNPKYIDACWNNILYRQRKSYNGFDIRFEKAGYMYKVIKKVQLTREDTSGKTIILDEGVVNLIDRALYKSELEAAEKGEIAGVLESAPLPDAVIYIETSLEENVKRLLQRKELRDMHRLLSKEDLVTYTRKCRQRLTTTIDLLKEKEIPILYLDSTDPAGENAKKIIHFSKTLYSLKKIEGASRKEPIFPEYQI